MATHKPIQSRSAMIAIGLSFTVAGCVASPNPNIALYEQPVFYTGIGVGGSHLEVDTSDKDFNQTDSASVAGQLTLGLAMAQSWGFELRVADLGEAKFEEDRVLAYQVVDVSAFGKLPLTPQASVFARLGAGSLSNSGSDFTVNQESNSHVVIGAGINYDLSQRFSVRAEFSGHDVDARHALLSLIYRFNPQGTGRPAESVAPADPVVSAPAVTDRAVTAPTVTAPAAIKPNVAEASVAERAVTTPSVTAPTVNEPSVNEATVIDRAAIAPATEIADKPSSSATTPRPTITRKPDIAEPQTTPVPKPAVNVPKQSLDTDVDGVVDTRDDCPGTAVAEPVNASGCALFGPVVPGVVFNDGSASLNVESMTALDAIVASLKNNPEMRVIIGAYISQSNDSASDLLLSRRRTIAVIRYLRAGGIDAARIQPNSNALEVESTTSFYENRIGIKRQ